MVLSYYLDSLVDSLYVLEGRDIYLSISNISYIYDGRSTKTPSVGFVFILVIWTKGLTFPNNGYTQTGNQNPSSAALKYLNYPHQINKSNKQHCPY